MSRKILKKIPKEVVSKSKKKKLKQDELMLSYLQDELIHSIENNHHQWSSWVT